LFQAQVRLPQSNAAYLRQIMGIHPSLCKRIVHDSFVGDNTNKGGKAFALVG